MLMDDESAMLNGNHTMPMGGSCAMLMDVGRAMSNSTTLAAVNKHLADAGIAITQEDALMLNERRIESLAETERVEFGTPAVAAIAEAIVTSPFLMQDSVADTLAELQSTFYSLRNELSINVPDAEIIEALRGCFDANEGDATEVASLPKEAIMAFSKEYLRSSRVEELGEYRIVDDEGRVYTFNPSGGGVDEGNLFAFNPSEWDYDEQAAGWDGERWSDDWND